MLSSEGFVGLNLRCTFQVLHLSGKWLWFVNGRIYAPNASNGLTGVDVFSEADSEGKNRHADGISVNLTCQDIDSLWVGIVLEL